MEASKNPPQPPFITIQARWEYTGSAYATIDIPQEELRQRLKNGESLYEIAEELFHDVDYSEVDESDNDPFVNNELTIERVLGVGRAEQEEIAA